MSSEIYTPNQSDRVRMQYVENAFKVSGDGVFATLQGEGITAGAPAVFFRLHFCNLKCGFKGGWKCDTGYTWDTTTKEFWQEPDDWDIEYSAIQINNAWNDTFGDYPEKRAVITGGEPMLQQQKIVTLISLLPGWMVEIETNGTIMPVFKLTEVQFNCSPKLANSGNAYSRRYKPAVLAYINSLPRSQFKFVVVNDQDLAEIEHIVHECQLAPEKILIMPEGQTPEAVRAHAALISKAVDQYGWKIIMRHQLDWYGPKRRT